MGFIMTKERLSEVIREISGGILDGTYASPNDVPIALTEEFEALDRAFPVVKDVDLISFNRLSLLIDEETARRGVDSSTLLSSFQSTRDVNEQPYENFADCVKDFERFLADGLENNGHTLLM